MTIATPEQIRQFAHGQLEDASLEQALADEITKDPNGQVANHLRAIQERAKRFLDPNDGFLLHLLNDAGDDSPKGMSPTTRDLIVLDSANTHSEKQLIGRSTSLPARVWRGVIRNPRQAAAVAACIGFIAFAGYRTGVTSKHDSIAYQIESVNGRILTTSIEDERIFVACDRTKPLNVRLDNGETTGRWRRVTPNADGLLISDGIEIQWPNGRPGCLIIVDGASVGLLYIVQAEGESSGIAIVPLPPRPSGVVAGSPALLESPFNANDAVAAQSAWTEHLQVDQSIENSIGMKLQLVPPGTFLMGSNKHESNHQDDEYEHLVRLTKPFYASVHETTQAEFEAVMGYNPSYFQDDLKLPVESLTWFEMVEFANRLSASEQLSVCYDIFDKEITEGRIIKAQVNPIEGDGYRLPTEAEWEYCCRAGTTGRWYSGPVEDRDNILKIAHIKLSGSEPRTVLVGSQRTNVFGLYDTIGNVWEWTQDWYDDSYYEKSPSDNPPGPTAGRYKTIRGGSWNEPPINARVPNRGKLTPYTKDKDRGFRLVRQLN